MRDVESGKPGTLRRVDEIADGVARKAHDVEIEQLIETADAVRRCLALVHRRRPGCLDAGANQAEQEAASRTIRRGVQGAPERSTSRGRDLCPELLRP